MLNAFVCGGFQHQEEDGPCHSPKKSKRKDSRDKNPYSTRGLDKFSALLADLDERRQKVYSQMSPQDISFVRFAYSNTDDFVPIVVKVKNKDHNKKNRSEELKVRHLTSFSEPMEKSATATERRQPKLESDNKKVKKKKNGFSWNMMKWGMLRHPSFYVPAVMILILVFLTVFGRSVATLCTCVMWYVVPTLSDTLKPSKTVRKKDYVRGLSEKKMVSEGLDSPKSGDSKASKDKGSAAKHSHQKSW